MSAQTSTLDQWLRLESLDRQGYQSDGVDRSLDQLIALENAKTRQELNALRVHLAAMG